MNEQGKKKRSSGYLVLLILVVVAVVVTGWFLFRSPKSGTEIQNVLLISIDTCRADYLSCYGYPSKTTPNIDELAKEGILFENVVSPVPLTLPAHSSMLTGTIPVYHGVHDNMDYRLAEFNITLAEILKEAGFATGAAISAFVLDSKFGIGQAVKLKPDYIEAHNSLAAVLAKQNKVAKTIAHWKETLRLNPDHIDSHNNLAWLLATTADDNVRDPAEAVRLAKRACELTQYSRPDFLDTLAAAYAAGGDFAKAVEIAEKALSLVSGSEKQTNWIQERIELYKANKPYYGK